jgi:hypothetical protein
MSKEDFTIEGETIKTNTLTQEGHFDSTMVETITIDEMLDKIGIDRIKKYLQNQ